jgi:hypothetical protein
MFVAAVCTQLLVVSLPRFLEYWAGWTRKQRCALAFACLLVFVYRHFE